MRFSFRLANLTKRLPETSRQPPSEIKESRAIDLSRFALVDSALVSIPNTEKGICLQCQPASQPVSVQTIRERRFAHMASAEQCETTCEIWLAAATCRHVSQVHQVLHGQIIFLRLFRGDEPFNLSPVLLHSRRDGVQMLFARNGGHLLTMRPFLVGKPGLLAQARFSPAFGSRQHFCHRPARVVRQQDCAPRAGG